MSRGGVREGAGRPEGSKNAKTEQWESLVESITTEHAKNFNNIMNDMMLSIDDKDRIEGAKMYISVLEYFKPKYSRVTHDGDDKADPIKIIINPDL